jgi:hypothetical protein
VSTVAIFSLLIGSLLGGRFRIFILPPAIVLGVTILVFASVLQLGYFCGAVLVRAREAAYRGKAAPSFDSGNSASLAQAWGRVIRNAGE